MSLFQELQVKVLSEPHSFGLQSFLFANKCMKNRVFIIAMETTRNSLKSWPLFRKLSKWASKIKIRCTILTSISIERKLRSFGTPSRRRREEFNCRSRARKVGLELMIIILLM